MKYKLDKGAHSVYALQYHFVQVVKYRREVFENERIVDFLKEKIREVSENFEVDVLNIESAKAHFHMIFKAKPTLDIPRYINAVKTIASRAIQRNFPEVREKLWKRGVLVSLLLFSDNRTSNLRCSQKICGGTT